MFYAAIRPRNEYTREEASPLCASFPSTDQFSIFCERTMLVPAIDIHTKKHLCCCSPGVHFPISEHSTDNPETAVLPPCSMGVWSCWQGARSRSHQTHHGFQTHTACKVAERNQHQWVWDTVYFTVNLLSHWVCGSDQGRWGGTRLWLTFLFPAPNTKLSHI